MVKREKHILFLCVANSARSQMAEGIARSMAPEGIRVSSAGSHPSSVRPEAIQVLSEIGIDISHHRSKSVDDLSSDVVDTVITLCAEEVCPVFLSPAERLHWGLPDPSLVEGDIDELPKGVVFLLLSTTRVDILSNVTIFCFRFVAVKFGVIGVEILVRVNATVGYTNLHLGTFCIPLALRITVRETKKK